MHTNTQHMHTHTQINKQTELNIQDHTHHFIRHTNHYTHKQQQHSNLQEKKEKISIQKRERNSEVMMQDTEQIKYIYRVLKLARK
mgnify:CR=1 FL=1